MTHYKISNSQGRVGRVWDRTYGTVEEAAEALRDALDWDQIELGQPFETGDGHGWTAYPDAETRDTDNERVHTHAPTIVQIG